MLAVQGAHKLYDALAQGGGGSGSLLLLISATPSGWSGLEGVLGLLALQVEVGFSWADPTLSHSDGNGRAGLMFL